MTSAKLTDKHIESDDTIKKVFKLDLKRVMHSVLTKLATATDKYIEYSDRF